MVKAVVGANWGDEGKGKITDMLASESDVIIRFQGGSNAGHTIINNYGKFALHQLPSGIFSDNVMNIIANGVALDIKKFTGEVEAVKAKGVNPHIMVSDRVQVVMPYHILFDKYEEERLGGKSFGSTKSGIAPLYSDKYAKTGFQLCELFDDKYFYEKLKGVLEVKNLIIAKLYKKEPVSVDEIFAEMTAQRDAIAPYVGNTFAYLRNAIRDGKNILLEGQLGALKDTDHGIYPMVTSSSTIAGFGAVGAGIPPYEITDIIAVVKAYSSAVGAGAFVSEIFGDEAQEMRVRGGDGGEFGATTGRPRRMGWFDCVATRYGVEVQGATEAVVTVVDALGYLDELKVCVGYEVDGTVTREFPTTPTLERAKPVLKTLPGWKCDIRGIRKYSELPKNCRDYIEFIEKEIGVPVTMVSNGPSREDIIIK
ncbi:MAG: adenylosuccinate synthase [Oscillospiraceae bacterium]